MLLFEEKIRNDNSFAKLSEGDYEFYDRSSLGQSTKVRSILNEWFKDYPEIEKEDFKNRIQTEFSSCFFELLVYQMFLKMNFEVSVHPKISGSKRTPDFKVKKEDLEFFVEATIIDQDLDKSENKIRAVILDELNSIYSPNFSLSIDHFNLKTGEQPSPKKIANFFEKQIKNFDPDKVGQTILMNKDKLSSRPVIVFENKKVKIEASLLPIDKKYRLESKRSQAIGLYNDFGIRWSNTPELIRTTLSKKSGHYGKFKKPFFVFINFIGRDWIDEDTVYDALFGRQKVEFQRNSNTTKSYRELDGFFGDDLKPNYSRLTGTFLTKVVPENLHVADHWLVKHPFSEQSFDFRKLKLQWREVLNNRVSKVEGKSISDILEIPGDWFVRDSH